MCSPLRVVDATLRRRRLASQDLRKLVHNAAAGLHSRVRLLHGSGITLHLFYHKRRLLLPSITPPPPPPPTIIFPVSQRLHVGDALLDHISLSLKADALVLLGDNIYADTLDPAAIASMYAQAQSRAAYARLAATMPVIAIYDDHDFAFNDAKGAQLPPAHRDSSQQVRCCCQAPASPCG